ncbi:MAG: ribonuclease domain-containing protein [Coriobacteriales bacterium]|nr:ribonuclease domain-containing protein [Coriobacteriales bacterium]
MKKTRLLALFIALLFVLTGNLVLGGCSASAGDKQSASDSQTAVAEQEELVQQDEVVEEVPIEGDASSEEGADEKGADAQEDQAPAATEDDVSASEEGSADEGIEVLVDEDGEYTSKDEVALYIHTYAHLPSNYITKREAENAGWKKKGLTLAQACPGKSIGGDRFSNREGRLPKASGRTWYECDIDYDGGRSRNSKRILYSDDGLIYYTDDHYNTFERLY